MTTLGPFFLKSLSYNRIVFDTVFIEPLLCARQCFKCLWSNSEKEIRSYIPGWGNDNKGVTPPEKINEIFTYNDKYYRENKTG